MPMRTANTLEVKRTFSQGMPKNAFSYSQDVNEQFLNDNLGIIEEIEYRNKDHYIPKWFKSYQNGIYRDTDILNHDNFFKEKNGDLMENIDKYHFKHNGRIYAKVSGASPTIINSARFGGSTEGDEIEFGNTDSLSSTGTVLALFTDDINQCTVGNLYDEMAVNRRTGTTNIRMGCYDDLSYFPENLLGETGSAAWSSIGYTYQSMTEFAMTTAQFWLGYVLESSGAGGWSRTSDAQMEYRAYTYGALPDPADNGGSLNNNGIRTINEKIRHSANP